MTALSTMRLNESTDSLLRFALRADATCSLLMGIAGIPLAGWMAEISGTTKAFEYSVSALFMVFAVAVFALAALPSVKLPGIAVAVGNVVFTIAAVGLVLADVFPLTTTGVVLTLAAGVYTLGMAELQYQGVRRIKA
ncbi:hypothetical protein [Mycolicibacterium celeriflavum]|uniref:Uncharacterized protein n=1 Tax=Mycolicibacterium celeriflavum TaxID=1249101 RepID=A0A1X0BVW7_MYCCF|nr:hypothetical protein [Mycolicibacterium celeriflavum]MCV7238534.1 hypothetical protein [Mycolicibacterium celeriflavum]ORA48377.1 hypothetical protein BST21_09590 [Mycolicibacterium celeriflavum]BBY46095.1 hypothetical protein MCEL_43900 [Mycolicibacterium celeriflavum]